MDPNLPQVLMIFLWDCDTLARLANSATVFINQVPLAHGGIRLSYDGMWPARQEVLLFPLWPSAEKVC